MINFIIPIFFLYLIFRLNTNKKNIFSPSSFVIVLYLLSALCAIPYIYLFEETKVLSYKYLGASIMFTLLLLSYLIPFASFNEMRVHRIKLPSSRSLKILSWLIVLFSLYSLIYFIPTTIQALTAPDIRMARMNMVLKGEVIVQEGIYNTVAGTAASFYQIPIILYFIFQGLNSNKMLRSLLLISSFSYVLFVFSAFGRDGVVFWLFSFIGAFLFFRSFLLKKFHNRFRRIMFSFLGIFGIAFMIITFSRFSENPYFSMISYYGQSIPNFMLAYNADAPHIMGKSFPLFRSLLGYPEEVDSYLQTYYLEEEGTYTWVFGTFLKSFIQNFGVYGTFLLSVIVGVSFRATLSNNKYLNFGNLFIYFLFFIVYTQGVFYFRQYNRVGNFLILIHLFLYLFFYFNVRLSKRGLYLNKLST